MYGSARLRTSGFTKGAAFFGQGAASAAVGVAASAVEGVAARAPAARAPFSSSLRLGTSVARLMRTASRVGVS